MVSRVEKGGAFLERSILDKYPLVNPVSRASLSRVIKLDFQKGIIVNPGI